MKKLTQLTVNGLSCDAVIESYMTTKTERGKIVFTDEENHIARHYADPSRVIIYVEDVPGNEIEGRVPKMMKIYIDARSLENLFKEFQEIRTIESDEVVE